MDVTRRTNCRQLYFALLAALISFPGAGAPVNSWTPLGPDGGLMSQLAFHGTSANIVYALAASGFHRSTDGGAHWQQNPDGIAPSAIALAVDPANSDRVYLSTNAAPNRLYVSSDAGATFSKLYTFDESPFSTPPQGIAVSADGKTLYAFNGVRTYRSADTGQTWQPQTDLPPPQPLGGWFKTAKVDPSDDRTVYVVRGDLLVTHDGGGSWTKITPPPEYSLEDVAIDPTNPNRLWTAGSFGVSFSIDRGVTWTNSHGGWTRAVAIDPHSPSTVYVAELTGGILKSTNNTTWSPLANLRSYYPSFVAVDPRNSSRLFVGNLRGLSVSTDGGASWARSDAGLVSTYVSSLVASSARGRLYASGNALVSLTDGGDSIAFLDQGALFQALGALSTTSLVTPTGDSPGSLLAAVANRIARSTDEGMTWTSTGYLPAQDEMVVSLTATPTQPSVYYASSDRTTRRSTNQGATWEPMSSGLPSGYTAGVIAIAPSNPSILYAGPRSPPSSTDFPRGAGVFRSTNGGDTWVPANVGMEFDTVSVLAVHPTDPQVVYVYGDHGLMKTVDGGATWKALSQWAADANESSAVGIAIDPQKPNIVYVVGGNRTAQVSRSVDDGATWQSLVSRSAPPLWMPTSVAVDPARADTIRVGTRNNGIQQITVQTTDLALQMADSPTGISIGDVASYSFTIRNLGPIRASGVAVVIQLPSGSLNVTATMNGGTCSVASTTLTCTISALEVGASTTVAASLTPVQVPGSFELATSLYSDQPEADASNNSTKRTTAVSQKVTSNPPSGGGGSSGGGGGSSAASSGGGGGGGAMSPLSLLGLLAFLFWRQSYLARRQQSRCRRTGC